MNEKINEIYRKVAERKIDIDQAMRLFKELNHHPRSIQETGIHYVKSFCYNEPNLKDHTVFKEQVLLGVTHCSLAVEAAKKIFPQKQLNHIKNAFFVQPVILKEDEQVTVRVQFEEKQNRIFFRNSVIREKNVPDANDTACDCVDDTYDAAHGELLSETRPKPHPIDLNSCRARSEKCLTADQVYNQSEYLRHGPSLMTLVKAYVVDDEVVSEFVLNQKIQKNKDDYSLHPGLLDGGIVSSTLSLIGKSSDTFVPMLIKDIYIYKQPLPVRCFGYAKLGKYNQEVVISDIVFCDAEGTVLVELKGVTCKYIDSPELFLKEPVNNAVPLPNVPAPPKESVSGIPPTGKTAGLSLLKAVEQYIITKLKTALGHTSTIKKSINFLDLGFDSNRLVEMSREIERELAIELYPTIFFEYQNIESLAGYLTEEYTDQLKGYLKQTSIDQEIPPEVDPSSDIALNVSENSNKPLTGLSKTIDHDVQNGPGREANVADTDIAVIGMAGVFAKSPDLNHFWLNIRNQTNLMKEIPTDHFDYHPWFAEAPELGKTYCKWGSFIDNVAYFDAGFFNISPKEVELMDPQLRWLLRVIYNTAEDAGYAGTLRGSSTGVFTGVCFHDYLDEMLRKGISSPYSGTGCAFTMMANRPSFNLDLKGPSIAVDTACSSSLVAIHLACEALRKNECDMAFAAGTNLLLSAGHYVYFSSIQALSKTGRCHTFDKRADGYVPGEGVAAILLKPLNRAMKDRDNIHAVIKGTAVNHGGYTPSITAPSKAMETQVIINAWENAKIDPHTIRYIEAHGTGTKLGDPVEINALTAAFKQFTDQTGFCAVGSAKAHIGHAEGAAGITGLIKVALSLKNREIPAMPAFNTLNPYIRLDHSALYINRTSEKWETDGKFPRRGGISSFGFGGTYAHLVLEEFPVTDTEPLSPVVSEISSSHYIIILSAMTQAQLKEYAGNFLRFMEEQVNKAEKEAAYTIRNIAYTLQTGREAMPSRLAIIASDLVEVKERLTRFLTEGGATGHVFQGSLNEDDENDEDRESQSETLKSITLYKNDAGIENAQKIAAAWVTGKRCDWRQLYLTNQPKRISLPTRPFTDEPYWFDVTESGQLPEGIKTDKVNPIHPLVGENTSDFKEQRFTTGFSGQEYFLSEHIVLGKKVLPGAAYIEMACVAAELAMQAGVRSVKEVVWASPVIINEEGGKVNIGLMPGRTETTFEIYTNAGNRRIMHAQGKILYDEPSPADTLENRDPKQIVPKSIDIEAIKARCPDYLESKECYKTFQSNGLIYGRSFVTIHRLFYNDKEVLSHLKLPQHLHPDFDNYTLHPSLVDGALQSVSGMMRSFDEKIKLFLPFSVGEIEIYNTLSPDCYVHITKTKQRKMEGGVKFDLTLYDPEGLPLIQMKDFSIRAMPLQGETSPAPIARMTRPKVSESNGPALEINVVDEPIGNATAQRKDDDWLTQKTQTYLREILAQTTKLPLQNIEINKSLEKYGINSIMVVNLTRQLESQFGELSKTLFFEYQNLKELAAYFIEEHHAQLIKMFDHHHHHHQQQQQHSHQKQGPSGKTENRSRSFRKTLSKPTRQRSFSVQEDDGEIAIVGLSGRYPMAQTVSEFWANLCQARDCITEVPQERWDYKDYYDPAKQNMTKTYSKWGGFLDDIDQFDPLFFKISPNEAERIDPQERLFLEIVWQTLEDAGYTRKSLADSSVGVFVGVMYAHYQLIGAEALKNGEGMAGVSSHASIANRVSYFFDFRGPSVALDTMCSSSLTAIHLACDSIRKDESRYAIAGGVNLSLHPNKYIQLSQSGFTASDGRCRSFGEGGDGYVPGEGVGAVFLKLLSRARSDNDQIYGVIKASALNHGGKTNGYTVPNPNAQAALIENAIELAGINPLSISYLEAHGTGTSLGDPIEITGLQRAFKKYEPESRFCSIGSVKSNIGHLESAAGIAGLTKVLLQMKYKQLVPSIHSDPLNPNINFKNSFFRVQRDLTEWKQPVLIENGQTRTYPRRAGLSSFGAGGANAHFILEEYVQPENKDERHGPQIFILSAVNEQQLKAYAKSFIVFLESLDMHPNDHNVTMINMIFTLQVGREAMPERLAIIVSSLSEVKAKLSDFVNRQPVHELYTGNIKAVKNQSLLFLDGEDGEDYVRSVSQKGKLDKIGQLWVSGVEIDWHLLYPDQKPQRISLPTYPFARRRCWVSERKYDPAHDLSANGAPSHKLHPLLGINDSDLEEQRYKTRMTGDEFYLRDHVVSDRKLLPGVAYLEMALAAGELAGKRAVAGIKNIVWTQPVIVEEGRLDVQIGLIPGSEGINYQISTRTGKDKKIHGTGLLSFYENDSHPAIDVEVVKKRCTKRFDGDACYRKFSESGLYYGPSFRSIQELVFNDDEVLARLALPLDLKTDFSEFGLHPSLLDGGLQSIIGLLGSIDEKPKQLYLPFALSEVALIKALPQECFAYVTRASSTKNAGVKQFDIRILDKEGQVCACLKEFSVRSIVPSTAKKTMPIPKDENREVKADSNKPALHYYQSKWEPCEIGSDRERVSVPQGPILIFDNSQMIITMIKAICEKKSPAVKVISVKTGNRYHVEDDFSYSLNPESEADYQLLFADLTKKQSLPKTVFHCWSQFDPAKQNIDDQLAISVYSVFYLSRCLMDNMAKEKVDFIYVHGFENDESIPTYAAISGFAKCLQFEFPRLNCKSIEIGRNAKLQPGDSETAKRLVQEASQSVMPATEIRYKDQKRYIKRLYESRLPVDLNEGVALSGSEVLKTRGIYLITGGAGGLGRLFAAYLGKHYQARIILSGRSELNAQQKEELQRLAASDAVIDYIKADITNKESVADLINQIKKRYGAINGIIHGAGVLRDALIKNKEIGDFQAVLAPKIHGTLNLDAATQKEPLDFFILFSSTSAVMGNLGQSAYAYANRYMDHFAAIRNHLVQHNQCFGKTISINWPFWIAGGMTVDEQMLVLMEKRLGMVALKTDEGLEAFKHISAAEMQNVMVLYGYGNRLNRYLGVDSVTFNNSLENVYQIADDHNTIIDNRTISDDANHLSLKRFGPDSDPSNQSLLSDSSQNDDELGKTVEQDIIAIVSKILKLEEADIDLDEDMQAFGFESITLTKFSNKLNDKYKLEITPVVFFELESPTVRALAAYLLKTHTAIIRGYYQDLTKNESTLAFPEILIEAPRSRFALKGRSVDRDDTKAGYYSIEPVAVIGMSGVFPQSPDLETFWEHLENGHDLIQEVPKDRWDWKSILDEETEKGKWGGFMPEIDRFDPQFFGISPREATFMDPQQRIFLEIVWKTIEDAGYKASALSGSKTGIFVGVASTDYSQLITAGVDEMDVYMSTGSAHSILVNRISYFLNFHGPSEPIDTACSSSLVAIHRAVEAIRTRNCDLAIAGGVNVIASPLLFMAFNAVGMIGADGRCKTFDKDANGYVRGEGAGAVFLKSLNKAVSEGDHIYAVIKGTAENHGGRANSLTAPNAKAQADLLVEAYTQAKVDPSTVSYIEAHGTGTSLGDPVEVSGLKKAFAALAVKNGIQLKKGYCGIGSVKTNIGHLETAAGIAGVIKVILSMKHKKIPASLHFKTLNPYLEIEDSPFYVVDKTESWEVENVYLPRRAGVSSFGFGGVNAHVVLEEYAGSVSSFQGSPPYIIVVSAKQVDQLKVYAHDLIRFLDKTDQALADIACTLQIGREAMVERLAIVVSDKEQLNQRLNAYLQGKPSVEGFYHGNIEAAKKRSRFLENDDDAKDMINRWIEKGKHAKLAEVWVAGIEIDWSMLYEGGRPNRISVPTYPFAKERYWVTTSATNDALLPQTDRPDSSLHALIGTNTSTLTEQKFSTYLTGEEYFLSEHVIDGHKMLPGVVFLEMARVAGELAAQKKVLKIKNVVWALPVVVSNRMITVDTVLYPQKASVEYEIVSHVDDKRLIHGQGNLYFEADDSALGPDELKSIDLVALKKRCSQTIVKEDCYKLFKEAGFNYGPGFQSLNKIEFNAQEALAGLSLPTGQESAFKEFILHPSIMDGAFQTLLVMQAHDRNRAGGLYVPFALGEIEIVKDISNACYAYVTQSHISQAANVKKFNILLLNEEGQLLIRMQDFAMRILSDTENAKSLLYYRSEWEAVDDEIIDDSSPAGLLLFDVDEKFKLSLQREMTNSKIILVTPGDHFEEIDEQHVTINPQNQDDYRKLFNRHIEADRLPRQILYNWCQGAGETNEKLLQYGLYSLLHLSQTLVTLKNKQNIQLLYLYDLRQKEAIPYHAALSGFAQSVHMEYPYLKIQVIGVKNSPVNAAVLKAFPRLNRFDTEFRYMDGKRFVHRMREFEPQKELAASKTPSVPTIRENGIYLITGGAGGLGLVFADYLSKTYHARIILCGRSELDVLQQDRVDALSGKDAEVVYLKADVSNRKDTLHLLQTIRARYGELNGILHGAGLIQDDFVINKTVEQMRAVLSPKVLGTVYLDEATQNDPLDLFVLFSSSAALLGNIGQSDYAFANRFMDHFVNQRERLRSENKRYGKTLSINWPLWQEGGMQIDEKHRAWMKNQLGLVPLSRLNGLKAFEDVLKLDYFQVLIFEGNAPKIRTQLFNYDSKPISKTTAPALSSAPIKDDQKFNLYADTERAFKKILSKATNIPLEKIHPEDHFEKYGIDSLMVVEMTRELEAKFGELSKTLFFEYQSLKELTKYFVEAHSRKLLALLGSAREPKTIKPAIATQTFQALRPMESNHSRFMPLSQTALSDSEVDDIAVIGVSGRYPRAANLEEYWENLKSGRDCIEEIPKSRWDYQPYFDPEMKSVGKGYSKWGGFIDDVDKFDPLFFNISPREAEIMDPQERLFLECSWQALEDGGYSKTAVEGRKVGVFVGVMYGEYQLVGYDDIMQGRGVSGSSSFASIANRVSFYFNFSGPSIAMDTMCSSSLTAIHLACDSIKKGESVMALAGGVNTLIHPKKYIMLSQGRFVSSDGRCKSFGEGGNGYVPGEGVGVVVLKPLSQAINAGDQIYAVIKGSSVNHGGRTNSFTVPNPVAQGNLIKDVFQKAQIDPQTISYIEAHGTGTSLGDPIEIAGLKRAFGANPNSGQYCSIGSAKSNIGHLESAAGIAGVTKVLLMLKYRQLVPSIHSDPQNPNIDFKNTPFYVQKGLSEWHQPEVFNDNGEREICPRRAGISSFGAGGANAHVVLEAYQQEDPQEDEHYPEIEAVLQIIVLSARDESRLKMAAKNLALFIEKQIRSNAASPRGKQDFIENMAYTLQVGREAMDARLALVVSNLEELKTKLDEYVQGEGKNSEKLFTGSVKGSTDQSLLIDGPEGKAYLDILFKDRKIEKMARLWVTGVTIDWQLLYPGRPPRRISLPTYPFARKRFWVPETKPSDIRGDTPRVVLHPFLGANTSDFNEQRFTTLMTGEEFYLGEHLIADRKVLPGVAFLEMARAAGALSGKRRVTQIKNIVFAQPVVVEKSLDVHIGLYPAAEWADYEVYTQTDLSKTVHSKGKLLYVENEPRPLVNLEAVKNRCKKVLDRQSCYKHFRKIGIAYGEGFQSIQEITSNANEVLASLSLPDGQKKNFNQFGLHPSLMDGGLQSIIGLFGDTDKEANQIYLPFALGEVDLIKPLPEECYAYATLATSAQNAKVIKFDIRLLDNQGQVCVHLKEFSVRSMAPAVVQEAMLSSADKNTEGKISEEKAALHYYQSQWEPCEIASVTESSTKPKGPVLIFDSSQKISAAIKEIIEKQNPAEKVILVKPGRAYHVENEKSYSLNPGSEGDYQRLFDDLEKDRSLPKTVFHFWSQLDHANKDIDDQLALSVYSVFYLSRCLIETLSKEDVDFIYAYELEKDESIPIHAAIAGFAKCLQFEAPRISFKIIEIDKKSGLMQSDSEKANCLIQESSQFDKHTIEIRYTKKQRHVKRLHEFKLPAGSLGGASQFGPAVIKKGGIYLITGGAGGLGRIFAAFFAEQYNARIILSGRSELNAQQRAELADVASSEAIVDYIKADIADKDAVADLIEQIKKKYGAINGVIHSAGVIRDALIKNKTIDDFQTVLAPKIKGTLNLDAATKNEPLDFLILFSSSSALIGNFGQSAYAYANRFMDHFAAVRNGLRSGQKRFGKTLSINWPFWETGGMRIDAQVKTLMEKMVGMAALTKDDGLASFKDMITTDMNNIMVLYGNGQKMNRYLGVAAAKSPVDRDIGDAQTVKNPPRHPSGMHLQQNMVVQLREMFAEIIKVDVDELDVQEDLSEYGLDSIMMMKALETLENEYNITVDPSTLIEHTTIESVAKYLVENQLVPEPLHSKTEEVAVASRVLDGSAIHQPEKQRFLVRGPSPRSTQQYRTSQKIAVIGMACRFPQSKTPEAFWENLKLGKDLISELPMNRWTADDHKKVETALGSQRGPFRCGNLEDIDFFDAKWFRVSEKDAVIMDPQHRILLEMSQELLDRSGYRYEDVEGRNISVWLGGASSTYHERFHDPSQIDYLKHIVANSIPNMMAARISDYFNLKGSSQTIDTACSSSLVAIHHAIQIINSGEADMAIAGGIELIMSPNTYLGFESGGVLSDDGRSYVFDERANGFVLGEGAGLVLLKSYDKALVDADQILAVISASAINNDGKTVGVTVPSKEGQKEVIQSALNGGNISPDTITYLEAHGTGTLLGDPIEIAAATEVYQEKTSKRGYCAVGSVKANIGHLLHAAGIASFIKVVLCLQHQLIPKTIHCEKPHPRFQFAESPFYPNLNLQKWLPPDNLRRAAVSSFGFGGTNCHMILDEFVAEKHPEYNVKRMPLSASNFRRKRYWIGKPIIPMNVLNQFNKNHQFYEQIIKKLSNGEISPDDALVIEVMNT